MWNILIIFAPGKCPERECLDSGVDRTNVPFLCQAI